MPAAYPKWMTEHKLYHCWKMVKPNKRNPQGCCPEWLDINIFYEWALPLWKEGLRFCRKNYSEPCSPDNCFFGTYSEAALTKSLGPDLESWVNKKFNRLTIIAKPYTIFQDGKNQSTVDCLCDCGNKHTVNLSSLKSGEIKSCGCLCADNSAEAAKLRRKYPVGATKHPLYRVWQTMVTIAKSENIEICAEWLDFNIFFEWGIKGLQSKLCFNRIDDTLGYFPENCNFITFKQLTEKNDYEEITRKREEVMLKLYGFKSPGQIPKSKEKKELTNIEKYGGKSPFCSSETREKSKITNLAVRGCEYATQSKDVKEKTRQTCIDIGKTKIYQGKTIAEWAVIRGLPRSTLTAWVAKFGFEKALTMELSDTNIECIIEWLLMDFEIEYIREFRIENRRADFFIADYNLVIETDGLYWHCETHKDEHYHKMKRDLYLSHGYESFFFYEDEIGKKLPVIKHLIKQYCQEKTLVSGNLHIYKGNVEWLNERHLSLPADGITHQTALVLENGVIAQIEYELFDGEVWIRRFAEDGPYSNLLEILAGTLREYGDIYIWRNNRFDKFSGNPIRNRIDYVWCRDKYQFPKKSFTEGEASQNRCERIWDCGSDLIKL